jgi:hypothetical protein
MASPAECGSKKDLEYGLGIADFGRSLQDQSGGICAPAAAQIAQLTATVF